MNERLKTSIEDIKVFINKSIITILSFHLIAIICYLNRQYFGDDTPLRFLDVTVHSEYTSFLSGILYFAFTLVMYSKFHQLGYLIEKAGEENQKDDLFDILKYYHWIFYRTK